MRKQFSNIVLKQMSFFEKYLVTPPTREILCGRKP